MMPSRSPSTPPRWKLWRWLNPYVAAILLLPVLVLWRQDNVLFSRAGYIDPWFYVGYARNLVEFKRDMFPGHYTGSRLAWILPYYAVSACFSPVAAACILHLGVWVVAVLSCFFTLRWVVGVRAAFLTTVLLGAHSWLWYSVGWDYPDGPAIACVLLTGALYTYAALRPVRRIPLVLAGMAAAAALHCTLGWAGLAPLFPLTYIGLVRAWHKRPVLRALLDAALWSGLGGVLLTAALGIVNYRLDGNFWFFAPSFREGTALASQPLRWLAGVWGDHGLSPWLWFGTAAALVSLVLLPGRLRKIRRSASLPALVFSAQCLLTLAYLSYFQRTGTHGLSYAYYASYLMPFTFLVFGVSFWQGVDSLSLRAWLAICALAIGVPAFLWYDYAGKLLPGWHAAGAVACLGGALLLAALTVRRPAAACVLAIAGFAVLSAQSRRLQDADPHIAHRYFESIMTARSRLDRLRGGRPLFFWSDAKDPEYDSFLGLASSYISVTSYFHSPFPQFPCDPSTPPQVLLVALSSRPDAPELARRALADCGRSAGFTVRMESPDVLQGIRTRYTVTLLTAVPDPSVWHPMNLAYDAAGAAVLEPAAHDTDRGVLPLNGWRSFDTPLPSSPEGLDVHTPPEPDACALVYLQLMPAVSGRYRFHVRCKLRAGSLAVALRPPGLGDLIARSTPGNPYLPAGDTVVLADLKRGTPFLLQILNNNGLGPGSASFLLREVTVLREDLPR